MELYIHIPFCIRKCNYCDFLSFPCTGENGESRSYVTALCRELEAYSAIIKEKPLTSVFIGGGTPSILPPELMEEILKSVKKLLDAGDTEDLKTDRSAKDFEFTIECNPGTLTREKLRLYRKYGVNRLSIGLQSADDNELKLLGRIHSFEQFLESYNMAREEGFDNINIDLISAIPGQSIEGWERTLRTVAELKPEHISAYSLIIEPGTPFYEMYGDDRKASLSENADGYGSIPSEDDEREMYRLTKQVLTEYGYERYEISNYAKPGYESKHNLGYWTGEEYIGAGLGAASYVRIEKDASGENTVSKCGQDGSKDEDSSKQIEAIRYKNTDVLSEYTDICTRGCFEKLQYEVEELNRRDLFGEYMILHLRLTGGINKEEFLESFGISIEDIYGEILKKYRGTEFVEEDETVIKLSEKGYDVSNIIMADFI